MSPMFSTFSMFSAAKTRTAVACTAALLAASGALAATPAGAVTTAPSDTPAISHAVRASVAEARVSAFFDEYRLSVLGEIDDLPRDVRLKYLSPFLNFRLDAWAARNNADPVFRAQNIPTFWSVQEIAEELDFASVRLTERWGDGTVQEVWYTVRLADRMIVDLGDAPAF